MRGFWLVRLVPVLIFVITFSVLAILNLSRLGSDLVFTVTLGIFSLSVANIFYIPTITKAKENDDTARMGVIGVISFFAVAFIVIAGISLYLAIIKNYNSAIALDVLAIGIFILGLTVSKIVANLLNYVSGKTNYRSAQSDWAADMLRIANICVDQTLKTSLLKMSDDMRYISRDYSPEPNAINQKISDNITSLEALINQENFNAAEVIINQLHQDIAGRESNLKKLRSKV